MQTDRVTREQIEKEIEALRGVFSHVRLLDTEALERLCAERQDKPAHAAPTESRKPFWEKHGNCENCVVCHAMREKSTKSKLEFADDALWQVHARYVEVDGAPHVLEMFGRLDSDALPATIGEDGVVYPMHTESEFYRDVMTGAYNRRYYEEKIRHEKTVGGVAMIDLDNFKLYNDIYGHDAGDAVLTAAVAKMRTCIRKTDKLIRYGGDEFLLVVPGIPEAVFFKTLQNICDSVNGLQLKGYGGIRVSVSIGGVMCRGEATEEAVSRADGMMYRAKSRKNAVITEISHSKSGRDEETPLSLVVHKDKDIRESLIRIMRGHSAAIEAESTEECISTLEKYGTSLSLVVVDINMEKFGDFEILSYMNAHRLTDEVPVIIISYADTGDEWIRRAYEMGANDNILYPFDGEEAYRRMSNAIRLFAKQRQLVSLIMQRMAERDRSTRFLVALAAQVSDFRCGIDSADIFRIGHVARMLLEYLCETEESWRIDRRDMALITSIALIHDVGKIGVRRSLLQKAGPLTPEEYKEVQKHTVIGSELIEKLTIFRDEPVYRLAYEACRWHHERYDGKGYPDGLKGDEIPKAAQVVAMADVYDALMTDRSYRRAVDSDTAINMILAGECGAFNPLLLSAISALREPLRRLSETGDIIPGT